MKPKRVREAKYLLKINSAPTASGHERTPRTNHDLAGPGPPDSVCDDDHRVRLGCRGLRAENRNPDDSERDSIRSTTGFAGPTEGIAVGLTVGRARLPDLSGEFVPSAPKL